MAPKTTGPWTTLPRSATTWTDSSRRRSSFSAYSKRTSPAGVSSTDLAERSRSLALYVCSSWRICALTADCERKTFWPAREKLFSLATKTKVVSWSKSIIRAPGSDYSEFQLPDAELMSFLSKQEVEEPPLGYPNTLRTTRNAAWRKKQIPRFARDDSVRAYATWCLSCVNRGLRNRPGHRRPQKPVATLELVHDRRPNRLHGALKMNGLDADQRQCAPPPEDASGTRACREVDALLPPTTLPR